jgi:hypothetical protein
MDAMLVGLRDVEVLMYLDDLLIFSATIEDHVRWTRCKVSAIKNFPRPKTVKAVRAFLGLSGYYQDFI